MKENHKRLKILAVSIALVTASAACGDDASETSTAGTTTTSLASTSGAGAGGATASASSGVGGSAAGGSAAGGSAAGGSAAGGSAAGGSAAGGGGGSAGPCSLATAEDLTSSGMVLMTDADNPWQPGFNRCVRVSVNTLVGFNNVASGLPHPIAGGDTPVEDANSPITQAVAAASPTMTPIVIQMNTVGTFPFFCKNHPTTMTGIIFVE